MKLAMPRNDGVKILSERNTSAAPLVRLRLFGQAHHLPQVERGQGAIRRPALTELAQFPRAAHDDDVDACTQALNILSRTATAEVEEEEVDDFNPFSDPKLREIAGQAPRYTPSYQRQQQVGLLDDSFGEF